jgi:hypothetical protein
MQRPDLAAADDGFLGFPGIGARLIGHHHAKAVEPGLCRFDRLEDGVDIFDGRELAGTDEGGGLHGRHEQEIGIGHALTIGDPRAPPPALRAPESRSHPRRIAVVAVVTSFISVFSAWQAACC